jgi:glyoxylase-like metal-dependent hydrolase (beta-lactamase superfamily II)
MDIRLVRHATLVVRLGEKTLLVDPMLSPPGAMPPIPNSPNDRHNPLVPLPDLDLSPVDAVLVTHTHPDHFDEAAAERLRKNLPLFCQPEDEEELRSSGFSDVRPVTERLAWEGVSCSAPAAGTGRGRSGRRWRPSPGSSCAQRRSRPFTSRATPSGVPKSRTLSRGTGRGPLW